MNKLFWLYFVVLVVYHQLGLKNVDVGLINDILPLKEIEDFVKR